MICSFTCKKTAVEFTHSLSTPSKMPGKGYGLPASECNVGSKLRNVKGSVCEGCYAHKGAYIWDVVQNAQYKRLGLISDPKWIPAMVTMIAGQKLFRWHDSGDLQNMAHLKAIVEIARALPDTSFWLPTKEYTLIKEYLKTTYQFPSNLVVRVSSAMVDQGPNKGFKHTSTVHTGETWVGHKCPAVDHPSHSCKGSGCRACWDKNVVNISYPKH